MVAAHCWIKELHVSERGSFTPAEGDRYVVVANLPGVMDFLPDVLACYDFETAGKELQRSLLGTEKPHLGALYEVR
jgi:hypothetical protein